MKVLWGLHTRAIEMNVATIGAPTIDVLVQSPWDGEADVEGTVRRMIARAIEVIGDPALTRAEVAILLTDDEEMRALNARWRGVDKSTNVLSFPTAHRGMQGTALGLGDIAIAYSTTAREAAAQGKPFEHHFAHLVVHGFLHLLGHDHKTDEAANVMERLERLILARSGLPDPYAT
jgi:probable rRNA maturation factor